MKKEQKSLCFLIRICIDVICLASIKTPSIEGVYSFSSSTLYPTSESLTSSSKSVVKPLLFRWWVTLLINHDCSSMTRLKRQCFRLRNYSAAWSIAWKSGRTSNPLTICLSAIVWSGLVMSRHYAATVPGVWLLAGGKFRSLERHQWKGMDFAT